MLSDYEKGRKDAIEECAKFIEQQDLTNKYQWVKGSLWGNLIKHVAQRARTLATC